MAALSYTSLATIVMPCSGASFSICPFPAPPKPVLLERTPILVIFIFFICWKILRTASLSLLRGLEHVLGHGIDDRLGRGAGHEDRLPLLRDALDLHRLAARRGTDDGEHLLFLDQLLGEREGLLRAGAGILDDQLDLPPHHAALFIRLRDEHLEGPRLGRSEERRRAGHRQDRPDLDRCSAAWANAPDRKIASRTANTIPFFPFISLSFRSLGSSLRRSVRQRKNRQRCRTISEKSQQCQLSIHRFTKIGCPSPPPERLLS